MMLFSICITSWRSPCFLLVTIHVIIPLLDCLFPLDHHNPTKEESKIMEKQLKFKFPLYLSVVLDWCCQFYILNWFYYHGAGLSYCQIVLLVLSAGYGGASNINIAHELLHKNNMLDKFLGIFSLLNL